MNNKYAELVEKLRDYSNVSLYAREFAARELLKQAADSIESLSAELEKQENGGWIKCSEHVPETVKVWGCMEFVDEKGNVFHTENIVYYVGDGNFTNWVNAPVSVVAWQPFPEPYKESEES